VVFDCVVEDRPFELVKQATQKQELKLVQEELLADCYKNVSHWVVSELLLGFS
jgi:hypothetical protein